MKYNLRNFSLFIFSLFAVSSKICRGADYHYEACSPTNCGGGGTNISFPFFLTSQQSYCGYPGFSIKCRNGFPLLQLSENEYVIDDIFYHNRSLHVLNAAALSLSSSSSSSSNCRESGGCCSFNETSFFFRCFCPDRLHSRRCKPSGITIAALASSLKLIIIKLLFILFIKNLDMKVHTFPLFILSLIITCRGAEYCPPANCGNGPNISFPFSLPYQQPDCGYPGFVIDCSSDGYPLLQLSKRNLVIKDIFYHNQSLRVFNASALSISPSSNKFIDCSGMYEYTTLPFNGRLDYFSGENLLLFGDCRNMSDELRRYELGCDALAMFFGNVNSGIAVDTCDWNGVARAELNEDERGDEVVDVGAVLRRGFVMNWTITPTSDCRSCGPRKTRRHMFFFIGGLTTAALISCVIASYVFTRRKRAKAKQEQQKQIEHFLKNTGNLAPIRYKYSNIKKMTNSFNDNLGKGGFGNVFKGQFPNGRFVAVKVLNDSNGNGEDFMNEVGSISKTSHINIVTLLGFCVEGYKRALVYDFMPNGSLEKFIGNSASSSQESGLGWDKLFEIALGVARGLEYLHQGCNTRILHLDIKPQNILLDKDMNPRISDFGLAKLCPNRSSIVSMMGARGTIGYIAPEVFSRNFGEVSYKSDVYSYGMLVLEMVGGRTTVDRRDVDCTSEIYFPTYLYKQIEMNAERDGDLAGSLDEEKEESQRVKRNLIIVGLWCIQTNPKDRPSMTKVVEMLEGKFGSLEVPPKPYLCSSPRAAPTYSTSESL